MLLLTRYANALYLFIIAVSVVASEYGTILSTESFAYKLGGVAGTLVFGAFFAIPYFFSYRATKTGNTKDVKSAIVASTVLLALCGLFILFGLATDHAFAFTGLLLGLPALFAVNTFKNWPANASAPTEGEKSQGQ